MGFSIEQGRLAVLEFIATRLGGGLEGQTLVRRASAPGGLAWEGVPDPDPDPDPPDGPPPGTSWPGDVAYDNQTLFSDESFWRKPLPALDGDRTLHAFSDAWINNLCFQLCIDKAASSGPTPTLLNPPVPGRAWWGGSGNNVCYVVPADQPLKYVAVRDQVNTSPVYEQKVIPNSYELNLAFMEGVPIPDGVDARTLGTPDNCLIIYQPSTDKMWEMISLIPFGAPVADESNRDDGEGRYPPGPTGQPYTFTCSWGGFMQDVSENVGVYQNRFVDGVQVEFWNWGGAATSLPYLGGCITAEELWAVWNDEAEDFGHTLKMLVANAAAGGILWPAQRTDGTVDSLDWIYEGARVFLPASVNTSAAVYPQKFVRALAKTFQKYGGIVMDKTGYGVVPWEFRNYSTFSNQSVPVFPIDLFLPVGAHYPPTEIDPPSITWALPWHLMKVASPTLSGGALPPPPPPVIPVPTVPEVHQAAIEPTVAAWVTDDGTHAFYPGATRTYAAGPPAGVQCITTASSAAPQGVSAIVPGTYDYTKIHRINIYLKGTTGAEVVRIFWGDSNIGDWTIAGPITLTTGWVLHTVDWIVAPPSAVRTFAALAVRADSGPMTFYCANAAS